MLRGKFAFPFRDDYCVHKRSSTEELTFNLEIFKSHPQSLSLQIMAIIALTLGVTVSTPFQIFVHEDPNADLPTLRWYQWLLKPEFYLVRL